MGIPNGAVNANGASLGAFTQLNLDAINRIKSEDFAEQASEVFARLKQQQHEFDQQEDEDLKPDERSQLALSIMQRHAAQMAMAAAAASASGFQGNAAQLANLAASVGSFSGLGGLSLNSNAMCQLNSALLGSNSSPSGTSGSSGSGVTSSPAMQSIEPGKGYTFEEQFKQVGARVPLVAQGVRAYPLARPLALLLSHESHQSPQVSQPCLVHISAPPDRAMANRIYLFSGRAWCSLHRRD